MIFLIIESIIYAKNEGTEDVVWTTLDYIYSLCSILEIDLDFHVTEKLKYNATRAYKHGKNY